MSNPLSVRRVQFQDLDEQGRPAGEPTFGILASDNESFVVVNHFSSIEELNDAIDEAGSILAVVDGNDDAFPEADHSKIGRENFFGTNWEID